MKFFTYIKYFYFLFINWNIKIAWIMIKQEIAGEKKYGINTTGADELYKLEKQGIDISHATIYMPVSYTLLEEAFKQLNFYKPQVHFLDIGCGKGRALCVAAGFALFEKLEITNVTNGARFAATVVHADANSGNLSIDGAGAHLVRPGDLVTLSAFAWLKEKAAREHQPRRVTVDGHNSLVALAQPESAKAESKKKKKN